MDMIEKIQEWHSAHIDHRLMDLPLMNGPTATVVILALYLSSVFIGPKIMKNRQPFDLKLFTSWYNLVQVSLSLSYVLLAWTTTESAFFCSVYKRGLEAVPDKIALMMYYNYILRIFEFTDTGLSILRKKENKLSFLHTYHHASNLALAYLICQYMPGGSANAVVTVNMSIHLLMYTYYFLSASSNSAFQKVALSSKKNVTRAQIFQFVYLCGLAASDVMSKNCGGGSNFINIVATAHFVILFVLFGNFYGKSYKRRE